MECHNTLLGIVHTGTVLYIILVIINIVSTSKHLLRLNTEMFMKTLFLFLVGGGLYSVIELLFRGHTHWLMFFVGGFCFILVGAINNYIDWDMPFPKQ